MDRKRSGLLLVAVALLPSALMPFACCELFFLCSVPLPCYPALKSVNYELKLLQIELQLTFLPLTLGVQNFALAIRKDTS